MNVRRGFLYLSLTLFAVVLADASTPPNSVSVDCNKGQSLNQTLAKLDKQTPTTVSVYGTCTEYVNVVGFENLVLERPAWSHIGAAVWRSRYSIHRSLAD